MTRLTLHRGANRMAPENTHAAAEAAIGLGADVLEVDVRTSADGTLHNLHDETVERTTNGTGAIRDLSDTALAALDAGGWFAPAFSGERVPTLDGLLAAVAARIDLFFDVKDADPAALAHLIEAHGLAGRCYCLAEDEAQSRALLAGVPNARHMVQRRAIGSAEAAHAAGYHILELTPDELSPDAVADAKRCGLSVQVWCPDDDADTFATMIALGVDYANVDHPELFQSVRMRAVRMREAERSGS